MSALYPKPLKNGGTIGIISPSSTNERAVIERGADFLRQRGFKVVMDPQNYLVRDQLAGSDSEKLKVLHAMFRDPSIDAIFCARGGNGAIRLLDQIDFDLIARNPKIFVGYSDISILLQSIMKQSGLVTYHGPMVASFGRDFDSRTADDFFARLVETEGVVEVSNIEILREGEAEGVFVGGNLTMLQNLIATPYDWDARGAILFIEDVDEILYRIDRVLHHFRLARKFEGVAAVLVGEMIDTPDGETSHMRPGERKYGYDLREILLHNLPKNVPIALDFPCGHAKYITTLPVGGTGKLRLAKGTAEIQFGKC